MYDVFMETDKKLYTVSEIKEKTGLSGDTIRYYERDGLLFDILRLPNGHRRYTEQDLEWIRFIVCLKSTGMPLKKIILYKELMKEGDVTATERKNIMSNQKEIVLNEISSLKNALDTLDYKIKYYQEIEESF